MTAECRSIVAVGVGVVLSLGVTACGNGGKHSTSSLVSAAQVCGGSFSPAAAAALEYVTEEKKFRPSSGEDRLHPTARGLVDEFEQNSSGSWGVHNFCLIYPRGAAGLADIKVRFEFTDDDFLQSGEMDLELDQYRIGRYAYAGENAASVSFECVSRKLGGSDRDPAIIRSSLRKRSESEGEGREYRDANMTMAHSAALAIAKELGCEGDGGLGAEPDLKPVS